MYNKVWTSKLKFKIWVGSNKWLLRFSTYFWVRLHLKYLNTLLWSSESKFKIWVWSTKRLQRYSTFNILRSSSIYGLKNIWLGHISLRLKFKYDPIRGCWDIPLLLFFITLNILRLASIGGRLHLKELTNQAMQFWFGSLSLSLKF